MRTVAAMVLVGTALVLPAVATAEGLDDLMEPCP